MKFKIAYLQQPIMGPTRSVSCVSENEISVTFAEPEGIIFNLFEELDLDLEKIDEDQLATRLKNGDSFTVRLSRGGIVDTRLPRNWNISRFPSAERLKGG